MKGLGEMSFIKNLIGKDGSKYSGCCGVEIKEVDNTQGESCCGTTSEQQSSCC